ncbi:MAG: beta family protein [Actinomycetota bacterium]|nr:beta family protein [Actinomycetota bacterium]
MESDPVVRPAVSLIALKSKEGELEAIQHTDSVAAARVVHMIELLDSVRHDGGRIMSRIAEAAVHLGDLGHPTWIDTRWLSAVDALSLLPGGPYRYLDEAIESHQGLLATDGIAMVPIVGDSSTDTTLRQVRSLLEHRDRDIGLRICRLDLARHQLTALIERVLRLTGAAPSRLHLIVDTTYVSELTPDLFTRAAATVRDLSMIIDSASSTLLTGTTPESRTSYDTVVRDRAEPALWAAVRRDSGVNDLRFGDYGVVHPRPKRGEGTPRVPNPYLNYTIPGRTLVLRRQVDRGSVPGAMAAAFGDLTAELTERGEFAGGEFSWGDRTMLECRTGGSRSAGSVGTWIAMATSHHISHLARNVDGRS